MRKIISKKEAEKKSRRNQLIVGGVLILVMFASVMGYAFQNSIIGGTVASNATQTVTYNGINFANQNGFWILQSGNERLVFTYNPTELNSSNLTGINKTISEFSGKPLYIYSQDQNAASEISYNMRYFTTNIKTNNNTLLNPDCSYNTIVIQNGTDNIHQKQNCIFITGQQGQDLIKLADDVMFKLLGIMK